jgi:hypothetical protein
MGHRLPREPHKKGNIKLPARRDRKGMHVSHNYRRKERIISSSTVPKLI